MALLTAKMSSPHCDKNHSLCRSAERKGNFQISKRRQTVYNPYAPPMAISDTAPSAADTGTSSKPALVIGERDIVFNCPKCHGELVVDREGAGLTVPCSHCGYPLTIPEHPSSQRAATPLPTPESPEPPIPTPARHFDFSGKARDQLERRFNELKGQLKENRSQDTEMRGHVNRATIDLHRLQLKLKKLQDRQSDIDAEINALADWLDNNAA